MKRIVHLRNPALYLLTATVSLTIAYLLIGAMTACAAALEEPPITITESRIDAAARAAGASQ